MIRPPSPAAAAPTFVRALLWLAVLAGLLGAAESALGQAIDRPADDRLELPEFEAPAESPLLPPVPPPARPQQRLSTGLEVFVETYHIEGSTVFSPEELQAVVAPWSGRTLRSEDLVDVTNAVTKLYVDRGYVNSGASLPDQEVADGTVELRIVEGSLAAILISGNDQFRDGYLRQRIQRGAAVPLQVHDLEERLQILQQDPRIERVAARLAPGERPGEAVLHMKVQEASRFGGALRFANFEPVSIGPLAGQVESSVSNLLGWGDRLRGQFTISEGLKRYRGQYDIPFTPWDTRLSLSGRYSDADVVESPFDDIDIKSTFQSYQIGLHQPVYQSPRTLVEIGVVGDWRRTESELLGERFTFPGSGAEDGVAKAAVLRFLAEWLHRDRRQVIAARSQVSWGIDALDATVNKGDDPDGRFVSWLAQIQWARRLPWMGIEAIFRTDLQLTDDPLLTMEQIAVGGYATVRGYRQNQRVQDQAVVSSLEVRVPLLRHERFGVVQLAPFSDVGHAWFHHDRADDLAKTLVSVGVGLRWALPRFLSAQIYWGQNLTSVETDGNLQDHGVQFLITASFP